MKQNIFVINSGSSSLKFQLIELPAEKVVCKGIFERIGSSNGLFTLWHGERELALSEAFPTHRDAVVHLLDVIQKEQIISSLKDIDGVGHRVAHGGEYSDSLLVTESTLREIENLNTLAPLHNPVNVIGIKAFHEVLPGIKQVAVFDTSFHQTMEPEHYIYPIPYRYYEEYRIRKYGFHGTSHQYIAQTLKTLPETKQDEKVISCHLGNGSSICAIRDGKSINTSMGFTPLAGLMMGTRSGDIDPAILTFLQKEEQKTYSEIEDILYKQSGLLGVSGVSNDMRDLEEAAAKGNKKAALAVEMFVDRVAHTIATYMVDLGGLDCLVFTAGIGENSPSVRQRVVEKLNCFQIRIDEQRNQNGERLIHSADSACRVVVLPTNEEIMIARDVMRIH